MTNEQTARKPIELRIPVEVLDAIPNGESAIVPLTIKVTGEDVRVKAVAVDQPSAAIRIAKSVNGGITLSSPGTNERT